MKNKNRGRIDIRLNSKEVSFNVNVNRMSALWSIGIVMIVLIDVSTLRHFQIHIFQIARNERLVF